VPLNPFVSVDACLNASADTEPAFEESAVAATATIIFEADIEDKLIAVKQRGLSQTTTVCRRAIEIFTPEFLDQLFLEFIESFLQLPSESKS
jgi:hypothetical protein